MTMISPDEVANTEALSTFGYTFVDMEGSPAGLCVPLVGTFGYICFLTTSDDLITNWCDRIPDRLLEQFENKQNLIDFICIFITELQNLEFVYGDLKNLRSIDTSTGAQLDLLGDLLNVPREGKTDAEYRDAIKFQIGIYQSNGEPEAILAVLKQLTNANTVQLIESYPARIVLYTDGFSIPSNLVQQIEQVSPAGVKIEITTSAGAEPLDTFTFFPDAGSVDIGGKGFSEPTVPGSGGVLTEKL